MTRTHSSKSASKPKPDEPEAPVEQPQVVEAVLDLSHFTNEDFEVLIEWQTGTGNHSIQEVFNLMDKIIVGGFRSRNFLQNSVLIPQVINQIAEIAKGKTAKN